MARSRRIEGLAWMSTTALSGSRGPKHDATDFVSHMRAYVRHNGLCVSRMRHKQLCVSLWGESETQPWGRRTRQCHAPCGVSRYADGTQGCRNSCHSSCMREWHLVTHRDRCSATGVSWHGPEPSSLDATTPRMFSRSDATSPLQDFDLCRHCPIMSSYAPGPPLPLAPVPLVCARG